MQALTVAFRGQAELLLQRAHLQRGCLFVPLPDPVPETLHDVWLTVEAPNGEAAAWTARVLQVYEGLGVALGFDDPEPVRTQFEAWFAASAVETGPTAVWWSAAVPTIAPPPPAAEAAAPPPAAEPTEATAADPGTGPRGPEEGPPALLVDQIRAMTTPQRMHLAAHGDRAARLLLLKDPNKTIQAFVLQNPHVTLEEVRYLAGSRQASPDALQMIAGHREWSQNAGVVTALVRNPKTPLGSATRLLDRLPQQELRRLAKSNDVPRGVQLAARKRVNEP